MEPSRVGFLALLLVSAADAMKLAIQRKANLKLVDRKEDVLRLVKNVNEAE